MPWSSSALTVLVVLVLATPAKAAAIGFTELPAPPGSAAAIVSVLNEAGQAAGSGWTPPARPYYPGTLRAVRWDGPTPTVVAGGHAVGINARGDVLTSLVTKEGGAQVSYVDLWSDGQVVDRTPRRGSGAMSVRDLGDSGVVPLGYNNLDDPAFGGNDRAGAWRQGVFADVPVSPQGPSADHRVANAKGSTAGSRTAVEAANTFAFRCSATNCTRLPAAGEADYYTVAAVNESDSVAATWSVAATTRAVVWVADRPTVLPGGDAGVSDNTRAINEDGDVVGWVEEDGVRRAALWRHGELVDLGTSGQGEAVAVNDRGDVVGWHAVGGAPRPFHWRAGVLTTLPTPDDLPAKAVAVNNAGVVVGGTLYRDNSRAFRWTLP
ncbi:hypothetical protein [Saccharothrix syringae]|uniref:HAF repeat-containing protein n=1 Tax=Saccharothrix syringae TaxID=103733 RepID=A0A5Q0GWX5_SACSY|nr:hypothetical protein [Saccharothrix syringae]QFZ18393.1 hypothetical protein EKG83_13670 [Saccharothrix syringae]